MAWFLALGFLIGMQHALEADHLAAVGAMAASSRLETRARAAWCRLGLGQPSRSSRSASVIWWT